MTYGTGTLPKARALADVATNEDKLFNDGYVQGIAEFIKGCATPMTIAIQGGWGSGKTSLISLVEQSLRASEQPESDGSPHKVQYCQEIIDAVIVDIWEQSVANPSANLFENLLTEIVLKLSGTDRATMDKVSQFITLASQIVGAVTVEEKVPEEASPLVSVLSSLFGAEENAKPAQESAFASSEDISALRASFVDTLRHAAQQNNKSEHARLVVFVDGLDQVNPEAAISLMEQIKIYLDCPYCVFVLAVDEGLVYEGIVKRLGEKGDKRRKKMFFDRLVQVPLRIPISAYNLGKFVEELLEDEQELSEEFAEVVATLLENPAPRGIKRYINTMHLYRGIFDGQVGSGEDDDSLAMLLAAVILEAENTRGFGIVANCAQGSEEHFEENLEAALHAAELDDGVNWAALPTLWQDKEGGTINEAKKRAFLSWVQTLR